MKLAIAIMFSLTVFSFQMAHTDKIGYSKVHQVFLAQDGSDRTLHRRTA